MAYGADTIVENRNRLYEVNLPTIKATVKACLKENGLDSVWPDTRPVGRRVVGYRTNLRA